MLNNRGSITLINALMASCVLATGVVLFLAGKSKIRKSGAEVTEAAIAQTYAAELLEVFASLSSTEMLQYMKTNPLAPSTAFGPYKICSHVNLYDRNSDRVLNIDPLAEMPTTPLQYQGGTAFRPNRYYQVQVIDTTTLALNNVRCGDTALDMLTDSTKALQPNERLIVTVGIKWVPKGGQTANPRNVVLSTVLSRL